MKASLVRFHIEACGHTDIGLVRDNNEDAWMVESNQNIFIVADGMGGHSAGEVAALEAVSTFADLMNRHMLQQTTVQEPALALQELIQEVNRNVYTLSQKDQDLRGMGTTLCCAYFHEKKLLVGNVGDSRCYLHRDENLQQITEDHSLVAELLELGELNKRQARDYAYRNIITKSIGSEPHVEPAIHEQELQSNDKILLCSDGLSDLLSQADIEKVINKSATLESSVKNLVDLANRRGGHDNITAVLINVSESHEKKDLS